MSQLFEEENDIYDEKTIFYFIFYLMLPVKKNWPNYMKFEMILT